MPDIVDETAALGRLLDLITHLDRIPLAEAVGPSGPGMYVIHGRPGGLYERFNAGQGRSPLWVGKTRSLAERVPSHQRTIAAAQNLDIDRFTVSMLPLPSVGQATYAETLAFCLECAWNVAVPGMGSHPQGVRRDTQLATPFGTLHPGRAWEEHLRHRDRQELELALEGQLRIQDLHVPPLWEPLPA